MTSVHSLEKRFDEFGRTRTLVVGDLMLDEYVWGEVSRISPDAPVQVVDVHHRSHAIGGAGNVAHNLASAGADVSLAGAIGSDEAGATIRRLLMEARVGVEGVLAENGRVTTVKTRIVARGQHVLRLDHEVRTPPTAATRARLLEIVGKAMSSCTAIFVSDYAKGMVDRDLVRAIAAAASAHPGARTPLIVDPKSSDMSLYAGCTAITPNLREAESAARMPIHTDDDAREAARRIREVTGATWVLITRGEKGVVLSGPDGGLEVIPARAREVYDVTGAGDTVLAYFGLGLATGMPARDAAELANLAAGIKIGKVGTAAVGPAEILAWQMGMRSSGKITGIAEAAVRIARERALGRTVVFTNGCFDLLHAGHIHLLEKARSFGDYLVVAVNSDASVKRLKGAGRPLVGEADRIRILAALDAVDLLILFDEDTPLAAIERIRPDVLVKGGDYTTETIVGHEIVLGHGGRVEVVPLMSGHSTSGLIDAIRKSGGR